MSSQHAQYLAVPETSNIAPRRWDFNHVVIIILSLSLFAFNYTHCSIFFFNKVYSSGHEFMAYPAGTIGGFLALIEIPLTILFVNSIRLGDSIIAQIGYFLGLCLVVFLTTYMGASSQNTIDELKGNQVSSYKIEINQLDREEMIALSTKESTIAIANKNGKDKALYIAAADSRYQRAMIKINQKRSALVKNKPLEQRHGSGELELSDGLFNMLFSFAASVFIIFVTRYKIEYIEAVMRIPVVSLKNKLNHEWTTSKDDFLNEKVSVSPLRSFKSLGFIAMAKNGNITPIDQKQTQEKARQEITEEGKIITKEMAEEPSPISSKTDEKYAPIFNPAPPETDPKNIFEHNGVMYSQTPMSDEYYNLKIHKKDSTILLSITCKKELNPTKWMNENPTSPISKAFKKAQQDSILSKPCDGCAPVPATGAHPSPESASRPVPTRTTQGMGAEDAPTIKSDALEKSDAQGDARMTELYKQADGQKQEIFEHYQEEKNSLDIDAMASRMRQQETAKVGELFNCVFCGKETNKATDTKKCCSPKCRKKLAKLSTPQKAKLVQNIRLGEAEE